MLTSLSWQYDVITYINDHNTSLLIQPMAGPIIEDFLGMVNSLVHDGYPSTLLWTVLPSTDHL